jgi:hypothetical protein
MPSSSFVIVWTIAIGSMLLARFLTARGNSLALAVLLARMSRRLEVETPHGANLKHTLDMIEATQTVPCTRKEIKLTTTDEARFWSKINKAGPTMPHMESPCWLWTAYKDQHGYGQFHLRGRIRKPHQIAWTIANGQIQRNDSHHGTCVCHRCDNPACCRADHLFIGTQADNMQDKTTKGRQTRGANHYARLNPELIARGAKRGHAKLTDAKVIEIRARYAAGGISQSRLAAQFGVVQPVICAIINRKTWTHI